MSAHDEARKATRRRLATLAVASAAAAALLGAGAQGALASTTASVQNGTLKVVGDDAANKILLTIGPDANTLSVDVGEDGTFDFSFDRATFTAVDVQGRGGADDIVMASSTALLDEPVTLDGGDGEDTLFGGPNADTLIGGTGNDVVDGARGNDVALLGIGDDHF